MDRVDDGGSSSIGNNLLEFLFTINRLKRVKRKGWLSKARIESSDAESVAEHSYMLTLLALIIAGMNEQSYGIDRCKVIKISLLHDIAESVTGDYMPEEIDRYDKAKVEDEIMLKLLSLLPAGVAKECYKLWDEYKGMKSKESILVHELDKLEMALQAKTYERLGYSRETLEEFYSTAMTYIKDPLLKDILKILVNK